MLDDEEWRHEILLEYSLVIQKISNLIFEEHFDENDLGIGLLHQTFIESVALLRGNRTNLGGIMEVFLVQAILKLISKHISNFSYPQDINSLVKFRYNFKQNSCFEITTPDGFLQIYSNRLDKQLSNKYNFKPDVELLYNRENGDIREFFEITTDIKSIESIIEEIRRYNEFDQDIHYNVTFIFVNTDLIREKGQRKLFDYIKNNKLRADIKFIQHTNNFGEKGAKLTHVISSLFSHLI